MSIAQVPDDGRYVNRMRHLCGCETMFDTLHWHSVTTRVCNEHAAARGSTEGPQPPNEEK